MKKFLNIALAGIFALLLGMTACVTPEGPVDGPDEPEVTDPLKDAALTVKINSASITGAKGAITTSVLNEVAYVVEPTAEAKEYTAEEIFDLEGATLIELECDEDNVAAKRIEIEGLNENTEYTISLAGRLRTEDEEGAEQTHVFEDVTTANFTTSIRPTLKAELIAGSQTANSAKLKVTTANISRFGYMVYNVADITESFTAPTPAIIFAEGILVNDVANGNTEVGLSHLTVNSEFVVYIAGELTETQEFYEEVIKVEGIKTIDFSESIRYYDITYNSFKMDVKAPENLGNHVIKWATCDLYTYYLNIVYGGQTGRPQSVAETLNLNDQAFGNYFNKSTTLIFDEEHSYKLDSESEDGILFYYNPMVAGQPQKVMMGEYRWGDSLFGWGYGYYVPLFDIDFFQLMLDNARSEEEMYGIAANQDQFWNEGAFFVNDIVQIKKPELLTKQLKTTIETRPDGAAMIFEPEAGLDDFVVYMENNEMHEVLVRLLGGEENYEKYIQWWVTSYPAMLEGAKTLNRKEHFPNGTLRLELANFFFEHAITRDETYRLHVVGLADDNITDGFMDGHFQNYTCKEFKLEEATEPAPTFELNYVPEKSTSSKAVFNLRSTNPASNVTKAYYVANTERAWYQINGSCQALVDEYGKPLQGVDIDAINSPEGLDIPIPTAPNEKIYMAVKISNIDGTRVYSTEPTKSDIILQEVTTLDLTALNALAGEWTATATIGYNEKEIDEAGNVIKDQNGNEKTKWIEKEVSTKITLGGSLSYPATLPESVYANFEAVKVTREQADLYFDEFKIAADAFNYNLRNSNRILCSGWGFDTTGYIDATYADAYELFASADYNGAYSTASVYDFGPKWYIQTDGSNYWVPFNTNEIFPLSSHTTLKTQFGNFWQEYHLIGNSGKNTKAYGDIENNRYTDGRFPVEISADGNTITIKPVDMDVISYKDNGDGTYTETGRETQTFYPCVGHNQDNSGTFYYGSRIISNIVMTRGYTEPATPAVAKAAAKSTRSARKKQIVNKVQSYQEIKPVAKPKAITSFEGEGVKTYEYPIIGVEEFHKRNIEYLNSLKTK